MSDLESKIKKIRENHLHGSSIILQEIINVFTTGKYTDNDLVKSFSELRKIDPSMIVIHHFLRELKPAIGQDFVNKVQQYAGRWKNVNENIAENLKEYLPNESLTILTHSHSGVIIKVVKSLIEYGYTIKIIQTESQPGGEGVLQAKSLQQLGSDVSIINDNAVGIIMYKVNCCFLGVDQYNDKVFVNKIGSKEIVEIAKQNNVPVFVLGDTRKSVIRIQLGAFALFETVPIVSNVYLISEKTQKL